MAVCALFLEQRLSLRRILPVGSMLMDFDQQLFALLQLVAHVLHAVVRDLRHSGSQTMVPHDFHKRPEIGNALNLPRYVLSAQAWR